MNLSLPTSLKDVFRAPAIDYLGNRLNPDWSVNLPHYNFQQEQRQPLRFASYRAVQAWPSLYDFLGQVIERAEPSDSPKEAIRSLAVSVGKNSDASASISLSFTEAIVQCRGLLTIAIIGVILCFIAVPLASGLTYYFAKRRYRYDFRRDPCSSDSMATAAYDHSHGKHFSTASYSFRRNAASDDDASSAVIYSHGMKAMAVLAIISSLCAAVGVGGSFYFNDSFSFSLNRSTVLAGEAAADVFQIIDDFKGQFGLVATTLEKDMSTKMEFGNKAIDAFGNVFKDSGVILDLAQKSMAFGIFFIALTWESSTTRPLQYSVDDAQTALRLFNESQVQLFTSMQQQQGPASQMARSLICQNAGTVPVALLGLSPSCQTIAGQLLAANSSSSSSSSSLITGYCQRCIAPDFSDSLNPFVLPQNNFTRVARILSSLAEQMRKLQQVKFGEITVNQDELMGQLSGLQNSFKDDFVKWLDFYMKWYHRTVEPVMSGGDCNAEETTTESGMTSRPKTLATTTKVVTNLTTRSTRTTRSTTTPSVITTAEPQLSDADRIVISIQSAFNNRHYVTLALLIVATIQLAAMIAGSVCLLLVYCETVVKRDQNLRSHEPSVIEKAGRNLIIGGAVIYVAFTGPLLCLLAAAHLFIGGFLDKSVCNMVRSEDYAAFDRLLGDGFFQQVLPDCIVQLVDSIDEDLFNRVTVSKFLNAARNDETLNEFLRLDDTAFVRDVRSLKYLTLTSHLSIVNAKVDAYMQNLTDVSAAHGFFQAIVNGVDMDAAAQLNDTVKGCTTCVLDTLARLLGNSNAADNPAVAPPFAIGSAMASSLVTSQLATAQQYKQALTQYLNTLPPTYEALADLADTLAKTVEKRDTTMSMMRFVERYFQVVVSLVKAEFAYIVSSLVDRLAEGVTSDVGNMGMLFDFYDGAFREYVCIELVGAMNAFWFFVGIYLVFATISALLLFATYGVLKGLAPSSKGPDYWQNRSVVLVTRPTVAAAGDGAAVSTAAAAASNAVYGRPSLAVPATATSSGLANAAYSNNEGEAVAMTTFGSNNNQQPAGARGATNPALDNSEAEDEASAVGGTNSKKSAAETSAPMSTFSSSN